MPWEMRPNSHFTAQLEAQVLVAARVNGFPKGLNSLIQALKRASRGFRNVGYFTTMIFLRLGELDFSARLVPNSAID